jgi:hypothetical protein
MSVRVTALWALAERGDRQAAELVGERLTDEGEWPAVIEAAMDYARHVCATELVEGLWHVVRRGTRPNAWGPDLDLAIRAVETIGMVGGPQASEPLEAASGSMVAGVRHAAERARQRGAVCPGGD